MTEVFTKCNLLLKDNGSLYWFHNDMLKIIKLMAWFETHDDFVFKQFIVWNKRFTGAYNKGFLDIRVAGKGNRNYNKMAEYILYYVKLKGCKNKRDETGLTKVKHDVNNFSTLRTYFKNYQKALDLSMKQITNKIGRKAEHCFYWGSTQWELPTKETYAELGELPLQYEFVRKEYEELRKEYEELRKEYEELRYTFNNQKTHHSVWDYETVKDCNSVHLTQKPSPLIENIIKHSTNEGDTVLDFTMGSGQTMLGCENLNRNGIGIDNGFCEKEKSKYYKMPWKEVVEDRLKNEILKKEKVLI